MDLSWKFFLLRILVKEENNNVTTKTCKISSSTSSKTTGRSKGGNYVTFGEYGLQATTTSWITSRQIESARIAMTRYMKRGGKVGLKSSLIHHILKTFRSTYGCW